MSQVPTNGSIIVYNSGTSSIRDEDEIRLLDGTPGDERTALFRIDIIEISVDDPSQARIVEVRPSLPIRKPVRWPDLARR